ncbi:hypothetical protein EV130_108204 [Rhizobium azibense]|uniref:Uncharacterized protein n=3 Tax=Rhizobium azibense TaxID=1136135 RepID=A0A4R3QMT4_9HYPH|nr:hypothetical protein EV130_108204 [Rhizobium azibense]
MKASRIRSWTKCILIIPQHLTSLGSSLLSQDTRWRWPLAAVVLDVAGKMDSRFAETMMGKLFFREKFSHIPGQAHELTIKLLEAVCAYEPGSPNKIGTTPSLK